MADMSAEERRGEEAPATSDNPQSPTSHNPTLISSLNRELDLILGGGLPHNSMTIIAGPPGAGKTIVAEQIAFAAAKQGMQIIYFTNMSEPHTKLLQHMREFSFFDESVLGSQIQVYNINTRTRQQGLATTLQFIVEVARSDKANLIIVDSFRGLKQVLEASMRDRGEIFDMSAQLALLNCGIILIGEYTLGEIQTEPEFSISDNIIQLRNTIRNFQERRTMFVSKMRGVGYLSGEHSFRITSGGVQVFPRQESLSHAPAYHATDERIGSGLEQLDAMMFGGLIRSSSSLLVGSAGTGKTVLSLHFLSAGAHQGEAGLMVTFQENPDQLRLRAAQFHLERGFEANGLIHILFLSPVELNLDEAAYQIRQVIEQHSIRRVVIDSVAELESAVGDIERFDDFLASLIGFFRARTITTMTTRELTQLFGSELSIASPGLSYIVDNIILLRYIELNGQVRRALSVLKTRGSDHDKSLREFVISEGQVLIGDRLEQFSGIMTGMPLLRH